MIHIRDEEVRGLHFRRDTGTITEVRKKVSERVVPACTVATAIAEHCMVTLHVHPGTAKGAEVSGGEDVDT